MAEAKGGGSGLRWADERGQHMMRRRRWVGASRCGTLLVRSQGLCKAFSLERCKGCQVASHD